MASDSIRSPAMIPAIVLAAGKSSRMGRPKATLPLRAATRFSRASSARFRGRVGRGRRRRRRARCGGRRRRVCRERSRGAVRREPRLRAGPAVVAARGPARRRSAWRRRGARHARRRSARRRRDGPRGDRPLPGDARARSSARAGRRARTPVLIDRSLFDALRRADPAVGAKAVIRANVSRPGTSPSTTTARLPTRIRRKTTSGCA